MRIKKSPFDINGDFLISLIYNHISISESNKESSTGIIFSFLE